MLRLPQVSPLSPRGSAAAPLSPRWGERGARAVIGRAGFQRKGACLSKTCHRSNGSGHAHLPPFLPQGERGGGAAAGDRGAAWLLLLVCLFLAACAPAPAPSAIPPTAPLERTPLTVFCAGSLIIPFQQIEAPFEAANPDIDLRSECHGSIQVIRHVTELHEAIDVVATADAALIPMLMFSTPNPDSGKPYAAWYVGWATNRLALAYGPHSRERDNITPENWTDILQQPEVSVGLADPRFDASGYRALMALKLAEDSYAQPGLFRDLFKDQFRYPIRAFEDESGIEITIPEIVDPAPGGHILIRGASIQLIALLESGDLDYAFEYESVIRQHKLDYIPLPAALNLGEPAQAENYARVTVKLDFQRFASVKPVFRGEPITYGLTIPDGAPHPQAAARFIAFLLGPHGQAVMQANYQPLLQPLQCVGVENAPPEVQAVCRP